MNLRLRLLLEWLLIGLFASAIVALAIPWRGTDSFNNQFYDQLSSLNRPAVSDDILIVAIDDPSLAEIGKWPWSRDIYAQAITKLKQAGAKTITFDVIISEAGIPENDAQLAEAMAGEPPVFMPLHFDTPGTEGREYDIVPPLPILQTTAAAAGQVNLNFDEDGAVRRADLCFAPGGLSDKKYPHLMELVYRAGNNGKASRSFQSVGCNASLLIPYTDKSAHTQISFFNLVRGEVPSAAIGGRNVIIGATAAGMGDRWPVPYADGGTMPGTEIMANMLTAIERDNFIRPAPDWLVYLLSIFPIWLLLVTFLQASPRLALTLSFIFIAALLMGSAITLGFGIWFPPMAALLGILLAYPLWGWRRLQAVSNFMSNELTSLQQSGEVAPFKPQLTRGNDIVGRQSAALGSAIEHIRDLRRFVSDVIEDLPDPMLVSSPDGKIVMASEVVDERTGQPILGLPLHTVLKIASEEEYWPAVKDFLLNKDSLNEDDFIRFATIDGRTFVMRCSRIENDRKAFLGHIFYLTDISALAKAEAQREEVLSLLSHDMRAPQSAIIASLEGKLDKEAKQRIERNARRTMRLAQDFVDMTRMSETEFAGEDIILADLLRDVADGLWPLAEERQVKIKVEDKSDAAFVSAEPEALSRAFYNLMDNAIKFSPAGSQIKTVIRRIEIGSSSDVSVTISDEGPGIDAELLPRLFERFATKDKEQRRAKGTGLGLSYVETVAKRHGGQVRAENRRGGGADFVMMLPESVFDEEEA